jgi:hypothetical protein
VWLLTAPRNREPDDETKRSMSDHNRIAFEQLMAIHDRYNQVVRRVGREEGALVVDMDRIYRRYGYAPLFSPTDATHPTQGGHLVEAEALYAALAQLGLVPAVAGENAEGPPSAAGVH